MEEMRTFGYLCPKCGKPVRKSRSIFALEASNADLAEQMVKVIEAQRSFSYALKMVQTSDELESTANSLRT